MLNLWINTIAAMAVWACAGCNHADYSHDTPAARAEQARSLQGFENRIVGQPLDRFLGPRTGWILPDDSALITGNDKTDVVDFGGRAAAITTDGYYLTAFHVIEGIEPVLVLPPGTLCQNGQESPLGSAKCVLSRGRLVKHFRPHDIALIKFDYRPTAFFSEACERVEDDSVVFVAATDGYVIGEEKLGNGPFMARGNVIGSSKESGVTIVSTTIPVRGGMSGTPCSDDEGRLVGILTGGRTSNLRHRTLKSDFISVSTDEIQTAIHSDRGSD